MRVLLTGASGFIGSHTLKEFRKRGVKTVPVFYRNKIGGGTRIDLRKKISIKQGIDCVYHLAGEVPPPNLDPASSLKENFLTTLNLLEFCRSKDIKKFILASSMSVYGNGPIGEITEERPVNPNSFYSLGKIYSENLCDYYSKTYGINIVILRYSSVFGEGQDSFWPISSIITSALKNKVIKIQDRLRYFLYAGDVARANYCALRYPSSGIFNIGPLKPTLLSEIARKTIKLSKSRSRLGITPAVPERCYFSSEKAVRLLGWKPYGINEGLKKTIKFYKSSLRI